MTAEELDPDGILSEPDRAGLLALLHETQATEHQALDDAMEQALGHLPRLVRGPARKVLFG